MTIQSASALNVQNTRRLVLIPPKHGEPQTDPYAATIVAMGEAVAPHLVDLIASDEASQVVMFRQYTIGDLADTMLCEIYDRFWPTPEFAAEHGFIEGQYDTWDYASFIASEENRRRLQEAWWQVVETNSKTEHDG